MDGNGGVLGNDANTIVIIGPTLGVQGHSKNPIGIGVLGFDGLNGLSNLFGTAVGFQRIGVWRDAENPGQGSHEAIGVVGTSDTGVAVLAENGPGGCCAALIAVGGNSGTAAGAKGLPGISATGGQRRPKQFLQRRRWSGRGRRRRAGLQQRRPGLFFWRQRGGCRGRRK